MHMDRHNNITWEHEGCCKERFFQCYGKVGRRITPVSKIRLWQKPHALDFQKSAHAMSWSNRSIGGHEQVGNFIRCLTSDSLGLRRIRATSRLGHKWIRDDQKEVYCAHSSSSEGFQEGSESAASPDGFEEALESCQRQPNQASADSETSTSGRAAEEDSVSILTSLLFERTFNE